VYKQVINELLNIKDRHDFEGSLKVIENDTSSYSLSIEKMRFSTKILHKNCIFSYPSSTQQLPVEKWLQIFLHGFGFFTTDPDAWLIR